MLNRSEMGYNSSHEQMLHALKIKDIRLASRKSVVQNSRWPIDSLSYKIGSILAYSALFY